MFIALSYCSKPFVNSTLAETRDESEIHQYTAKEQGILLQACLLWRIFYDVVHRLQAKYPEWIYLRQEDISRSPAESFRQL
jgi:hypothetical protein